MTREEDLNELATTLSAAIEKARELKLPTSAYILSMARVEVTEAARAAAEGSEDGDASR